jgi:hypothetical protein
MLNNRSKEIFNWFIDFERVPLIDREKFLKFCEADEQYKQLESLIETMVFRLYYEFQKLKEYMKEDAK